MDYTTAWEKSTGWITKWYKKWRPKQIEYDDYYQECALYFWGKLKPNYEPKECWYFSKIAYHRVMIKLIYRIKENKLKTESIDDRDWIGAITIELPCEWEVKLKPNLQKVAELIADGYETNEICSITGKTKNTIYTDIKNIKRIYSQTFGITNYQRKHLRHFTRNRTERELECWQKSKNRLKAVQELRKREKCLQTQERLRRCAT